MKTIQRFSSHLKNNKTLLSCMNLNKFSKSNFCSREYEEKKLQEKEGFKKFINFIVERSRYTWQDYHNQVEFQNKNETSVWKKIRGKDDEEKQEVIDCSIYLLIYFR